jgi:hypothetical protein
MGEGGCIQTSRLVVTRARDPPLLIQLCFQALGLLLQLTSELLAASPLRLELSLCTARCLCAGTTKRIYTQQSGESIKYATFLTYKVRK